MCVGGEGWDGVGGRAELHHYTGVIRVYSSVLGEVSWRSGQ